MISSFCLTFMFLLFSNLAIKKNKGKLTFKNIPEKLRESVRDLSHLKNLYLFLSFICFLLLPLFWGLSFYLKTDYNVVVVVGFLFWSYNWTKYIYFK